MLKATTEADARSQLSALAHACGDASFAPPMKRSHDEHGLWLVFRGACPRCGQERELRFHAAAPGQRAPSSAVSAPAPVVTAPAAQVFRGGAEERELYGTPQDSRCAACDGAGEYRGVTGDYAMGMLSCNVCAGTGWVRRGD